MSWDKPGYTGREALLALRRKPRRRRTVHVRLLDPEPLLRHGESVLWDGGVIGRVTSGAYGHHLGAAVGLASLEDQRVLTDLPSGDVHVGVAGTLVAAELRARPFYDPDDVRLRS